MNTFAHRPPEKVKLPLPLHLFRAPYVGELLVIGLHAFVRVFLFKAGVHHHERLTDHVRAAYHNARSRRLVSTPPHDSG